MKTLSNPQPFSVAANLPGQTFRTFTTQQGTPVDLAVTSAADLLCAAAFELNALMNDSLGAAQWSRLALITHAVEAAEAVCRDASESLGEANGAA